MTRSCARFSPLRVIATPPSHFLPPQRTDSAHPSQQTPGSPCHPSQTHTHTESVANLGQLLNFWDPLRSMFPELPHPSTDHLGAPVFLCSSLHVAVTPMSTVPTVALISPLAADPSKSTPPLHTCMTSRSQSITWVICTVFHRIHSLVPVFRHRVLESKHCTGQAQSVQHIAGIQTLHLSSRNRWPSLSNTSFNIGIRTSTGHLGTPVFLWLWVPAHAYLPDRQRSQGSWHHSQPSLCSRLTTSACSSRCRDVGPISLSSYPSRY